MAKVKAEDIPANYDFATALFIVMRLNKFAKETKTPNEFLLQVGAYCQKLLTQVIEPALEKRRKKNG